MSNQRRVHREGFVRAPSSTGAVRPPHAAYLWARVQLWVVHLVRAALRYVSSEDSKQVIAGLKLIHQGSRARAR